LSLTAFSELYSTAASIFENSRSSSLHTIMTSVILVHPEETFTLSILHAITKCHLFQHNPALLLSPYSLQSSVSLSIFREFLSALQDTPINITATNFTALQELSHEFGFSDFSQKLSNFANGFNIPQKHEISDLITRIQIPYLNEIFQFIVNGSGIEMNISKAVSLFPAVCEQLSIDSCARTFFVNYNGIDSSDILSLELLLSGETISIVGSQQFVSGFLGNVTLEQVFEGFCKGKGCNCMNLSELMMEKRIDLENVNVSVEALDNLLLKASVTVKSEDSLLEFILKLGPAYRNLLRHIQIEFLSEKGFSILDEYLEIPPESIWNCAVELITNPPFPNSRIISDFPEIFAEFRRKHFELLWRGSRDGFEAKEFHSRCDGHSNTLTIILDTKGNIFGGFTPLEWESRVFNGKRGLESNCWKGDEKGESFIFTLKNPENIAARKFPLKPEFKNFAINCHSKWGPRFSDISVYDQCDIEIPMSFRSSAHFFGTGYVNDTGIGGGSEHNTFFTGSEYFLVKEIEVFEITN
jgi:hypothetical protein